jgi:apolipoprotein N-acyltransferase
LVPFGERLPLHDRFGWIADLDFGEADFASGRDYTVFPGDPAPFSANICFEAIFPDLCRRFVLEGATYLVNLTNDAWFGETAAPYQHAEMARFRCVELGLYLVRAANTGISLIADPFGRVIESLPLLERGVVVGEIHATRLSTFYRRYGDWFPRVELFLVAAALVASLRWRRGGRNQ